MIFENNIKVSKIKSFDVDPTCWKIAEIFNKPWVVNDWQFKASTKDIFDINIKRIKEVKIMSVIQSLKKLKYEKKNSSYNSCI